MWLSVYGSYHPRYQKATGKITIFFGEFGKSTSYNEGHIQWHTVKLLEGLFPDGIGLG